jgi:hypothetical protein
MTLIIADGTHERIRLLRTLRTANAEIRNMAAAALNTLSNVIWKLNK